VTLDGGGSSRLGDDSIRSIADLERFESDSLKLRARNLGRRAARQPYLILVTQRP
jgi:hypothetical protein